jgi:hypothetical protein
MSGPRRAALKDLIQRLREGGFSLPVKNPGIEWFGDNAELAAELGQLVRRGVKGASAGLPTQIAAQLGVRRTTIGRWRREGRLEERICNEMGQWLYARGNHVRPTTALRAKPPRWTPRTSPV